MRFETNLENFGLQLRMLQLFLQLVENKADSSVNALMMCYS